MDINTAIISAVSILAINTATNKTEVALIEKKRVLFSKAWNSDYDEAEKVLPVIAAALKKAKTPLDGIFVIQGPGGFTGLRIGVTIANTLAFVHKSPLMACTTFEYLQKKMPDRYKKNTAVILKAGGDFVAVQLPGKNEHKIVARLEIANFLSKSKKVRHLIGDLKKEDRKKIDLPSAISWLPDGSLKSFGQAVQEIVRSKTKKHTIVKPYYLQPPKITVSKKEVFVS